MNGVIVFNLSQKTLLSSQTTIADNFFTRAKGLLGKKNLPPGQGLVITHCNSIHMFFMKFPIDVVFVNKENAIIGLVENIKPGEMSRVFWTASFAIEFPSGTIQASNTKVGDFLEIK